MRSRCTWVLETSVFDGDANLAEAARSEGHTVVEWRDEWALSLWPALSDPVVFHGSLEAAARIAAASPWTPGAYCNADAFCCTAWYPSAARWLVHEAWVSLAADQFIAEPRAALDRIECADTFFVRPDSPLKPFAGRVLSVGDLSLAALDFGFYFDDPAVPVIVTPVQEIHQAEWRFVAIQTTVVAGSSYDASTRTGGDPVASGAAWKYAQEAALSLPFPEDVWVLDVCETDNGLRLLELNPFSGAALYSCDCAAIVTGIVDLLCKEAV